jgi:hypothetical protein
MFQKLLQQAFDNFHAGNNELALLSIMPIFDKACKKTWPHHGVGARFKNGVVETEDIITFIMTSGSCVMIECTYGDMKLPQIIYKYLRNSIIHEGEMPKNVKLVDEPNIIINNNSVQFPVQFAYGLLIASIGFGCYKSESSKVTQVGKLFAGGQEILIRDLVGSHQPVRDLIHARFKSLLSIHE